MTAGQCQGKNWGPPGLEWGCRACGLDLRPRTLQGQAESQHLLAIAVIRAPCPPGGRREHYACLSELAAGSLVVLARGGNPGPSSGGQGCSPGLSRGGTTGPSQWEVVVISPDYPC